MGSPAPTRRPLATPRLWPSVPCLALWLACAPAGARTGPSGEEVLQRGGELASSPAERATVVVTPSTVTVWGLTEVPDGSRLQMAFAGVDAIARSELLKAIEVRVTGVVTSVESTDPDRRRVVVETVEAVDGVLAHSGPLPHGWVRVRRGGEVVIRIWARLDIPRATLEATVRSVLGRGGSGPGTPAEDPAAIVGGLVP
jgi:hypothetical protein